MRAKEFIAEDNNVITPEDIKAIADKILRDCGLFIQSNYQSILSGYYLYRGIATGNDDLVIEQSVRKDRYPRDTTMRWHTLLDNFFLKEFGTKYRSESLFATTEINNTFDYGQPFVVFPKGEYTMCYSSIVEDVTVDLASATLNLSPPVASIIRSIPDYVISKASKSLDMNINDVNEFFTALRLFSRRIQPMQDFGAGFPDNFPALITTLLLPKLQYRESKQYFNAEDSEIMVNCNEYYGIRVNRHDPNATWNKIIRAVINSA